MATLMHSESRRLYSWWWDSHISPKSSKWLQDNLTDIDSKVKAMIKLIEEDADSFARRAEMYYKKRPELMKLVEEFYRAYRALAERYDHATVELRHAHKIMSDAFPNQLPFDMADDSASSFNSEELRDSPGVSRRNSGFSEDSHCGGGKKGLKQLNELLGSDVQVEALKKTLAELLAEKEALHLQYQLSLQKLTTLEKELSDAQNDAGGLDERASRAEIEIKIMGEALTKLEAERDAELLQYNQSLERISNLEAAVSRAQEDAKGVDERASKAETEAQNLKIELSKSHAEKEAGFLRYKQCLKMIAALEDKIKAIEETAQMFSEQTERAEAVIDTLMQELLKLQKEKDDVNRQHQWCLEIIAKLEGEIACFQEDAKRLNSEIEGKAEKLKHVEDQCAFLETSNQSLQHEADNLAQKIVVKDQELFEKENELEKVQSLMQDEHSRFEQLEASLKDLQKLLCQCQEEQKALESELQSKLQMLQDLEMQNHCMEDKISQVEEENGTLTNLNNSSSISLQIQQNELLSLKEMKGKLEQEVARQVERSNELQNEVNRLKEEIEDLNPRYLMLLEQVEIAGLNPESVVSSVKKFTEENSKLIELCNNQRDEKNALSEKLKEMNELLQKNSFLESSLLKSNMKLEGSGEKVKDLQERCASLHEEKSGLVAERGSLLSHLQMMTENMQKLLERNTLLENSLSGANIELEGLRAKSKCFEEFFQMLKNEKTELLKERQNLVSHLNRVEEGLGILEKRFSTLEGKYADLEKEKQLTHVQVEELRVSLVTEKQERTNYIHSSESRLADVQNHVSLLQEECRSRKKEFEEELDRAVNAQVEIFILQKFIEDLEQKNYSLLIERQKYVEASKFSEKIIAELGSENLEQQMEAEYLIDEIENLRNGIHQVFETLQFDQAGHKVKKDQIQIPHILGKVDELKFSLLRNEDEKQHLAVENSVFLSLLEQCRSDGLKLEAEKDRIEENMDTMMHQHGMLEKEHRELLDINTQLKSEVINRDQTENVLRAELKTEHEKLEDLHEDYLVLQREYSSALGKNKSLLEKFSQLKDEMLLLDEENSVVLQEALVLSNTSLVYQCYGSEKSQEVEAFAENLSCLQDINTSLKQKIEILQEELNLKQAESLELHEKIIKLEEDLIESDEVNTHLRQEILVKDEVLRGKGKDLEEAQQLLKATHDMNAELCRAVEEVKEECEASKIVKENLKKQVSELFEHNGKQRAEIEHLTERNESLEMEVKLLHEEVREQRVREEYLSLELQERSNEFGIWDSEATSFYFDLQISAVHEVLLENKVHELTGVCEDFRAENSANIIEIEQMKQKVGSIEKEMGELKNEMSAYAPIVASLRQDLESLERTARFLMNPQQELSGRDGVNEIATVREEPEENKSTARKDGILHLQDLQIRIRAIEQAMLDERNRLAVQKGSVTSNLTSGSPDKEKYTRKEDDIEIDTDVSGEIRQKIKPGSEVKSGLLMKDIPLDQVSDSSYYGRSRGHSRGSNNQMLELWEESAVQDSTINGSCRVKESPFVRHKSRNHFVESQVKKELEVVDKLELSKSIEDKAKILERLVSESRKLASLRTSLREMKMKMEADEKHGRTRNPDHAKVKSQLKEAEGAILSLINTTETLSKDIEETGDGRDVYRKRVLEQSHMLSEKTENLQFDVQNIERLVLKLEDGAKAKGRKHFSESRTVILLKDIIHKSGKRTGRKKKSRFCGCIRSSTRED